MNPILQCVKGMFLGTGAGCLFAMVVWIIALFGMLEIPDKQTMYIILRVSTLMGLVGGLIFAIAKLLGANQ